MENPIEFGKLLKAIRKKAGYTSAKKFYLEFSKKETLGFNYSYYALIEQGKTLPSPKVVQEISSLFNSNHAESLVLNYCKMIFPRRSHLFKIGPNNIIKFDPKEELSKPLPREISHNSAGQKELTLQQVSIISKSKYHYFLFFLFVISRRSITQNELVIYFGNKEIIQTMEDLENAKIIKKTGNSYEASSIEYQFPNKNAAKTLESIYALLDSWDTELPLFFNFENKKKKLFLRRTSEKQLNLFLSYLSLLDEIARSTDELDYRLNNEVFFLSYDFSIGKMPG